MMPLMASAGTLEGLAVRVTSLLGMILPIMMTIAVIAFFYGLAKYLFGGAEDKGKGLGLMGMGILALFVMASLGGLIAFMQDSTGVDKTRKITPPCIWKNCGDTGGRARGARGVAG